jgi:hypothetical protein
MLDPPANGGADLTIFYRQYTSHSRCQLDMFNSELGRKVSAVLTGVITVFLAGMVSLGLSAQSIWLSSRPWEHLEAHRPRTIVKMARHSAPKYSHFARLGQKHASALGFSTMASYFPPSVLSPHFPFHSSTSLIRSAVVVTLFANSGQTISVAASSCCLFHQAVASFNIVI